MKFIAKTSHLSIAKISDLIKYVMVVPRCYALKFILGNVDDLFRQCAFAIWHKHTAKNL